MRILLRLLFSLLFFASMYMFGVTEETKIGNEVATLPLLLCSMSFFLMFYTGSRM